MFNCNEMQLFAAVRQGRPAPGFAGQTLDTAKFYDTVRTLHNRGSGTTGAVPLSG